MKQLFTNRLHAGAYRVDAQCLAVTKSSGVSSCQLWMVSRVSNWRICFLLARIRTRFTPCSNWRGPTSFG
jgi:hypothetical protein